MPDAQPACPNCGRPLAPGAEECLACTSLAQTTAALVAPAPRLLAGRYLPERLLGRGGAKDVWLAHDLTLDRPVAVSRVLDHEAGSTARERATREARLMARLGDHPRIVTVYDAIEDDGALLIVARYMAGGSLAERVAAAPGHRLPVAEVLRAGVELADALSHAHENGVIHRDVKPDNAWLGSDESAALGDFGIASAPGLGEETGGPTGTPYYVAPEQASGERVGPAADLYALGATLYELVCGRPPFLGATAGEVVGKHLTAQPEPPAALAPGMPPALDALLLRLLAKLPDERPASAAEVRDTLSELRGTGARVSRPGGPPLIGREAELSVAAGALRAAREGGLRIVAIAGEPGIGKTRLAAEVETEARAAGALAVWGRGVVDAGPYALWGAVLRDLLPHVAVLPAGARADVLRLAGEPGAGPAPPGGEEGRLRLFDAACALLERAAGPGGLVVVLDDLHWADRSSLDLLRYVVRAASGARLLLVLTYREDGLERASAATEVLAELAHVRGFERIGLAGLALDAVRRFVPADAGLRDTIVRDLHERTGGNPFFVAELARSLSDVPGTGAIAVPASVREVVLRRLAPLPAASRRALDAAAVLGRPFTVATVARIASVPRSEARAALEPARVARLVTEVPDAPGRLAFAHAIVRDAVGEALAPSDRGVQPPAVAEVLAGGTEVRVAEVAHHALVAAREGEDPQPAYDLSVEAAEEAQTLLAHTEAARHYADALEALDELGAEAPPAVRTARLGALAAETMAAGDIEAGRRHYRGLAAAGRQAADAELIARAALGFAEFARYGELDTTAVALLEEALAVLPPVDSPLRLRVLALLGARLAAGPETSRSELLVDEAAADEILALANRAGDANALLWAHMSRCVDALEHGHQAGVEAELAACAALERSSRRSYFRWCVTLLRATSATFSGRLAEGEALAEDAAAQIGGAAQDAEQELTAQRLTLAKLRWRPQDVDYAALRAYAARYRELHVWSAMHANLAWELRRADQVAEAVAATRRDGLQALLGGRDGLSACTLLAEPAAGLGDQALAEELLELLTPYRDHNPVMDHGWTAWGPVARPLALLAVALGRAGDASMLFDRAGTLSRRWGARAWELRAIGDWLGSGVGVPDREAVVARGIGLANELELPWVTGRLLAYTTSP